MPYKLSPKKFELSERHPVSRKRFEAATSILEESIAQASDGQGYLEDEKIKAI